MTQVRQWICGLSFTVLSITCLAQDQVLMPSVPLGEENWLVNPTVPPTMQFMMIYGAPNKPGPFIFRAKFPPAYKLSDHANIPMCAR